MGGGGVQRFIVKVISKFTLTCIEYWSHYYLNIQSSGNARLVYDFEDNDIDGNSDCNDNAVILSTKTSK